MNKTTTFVGQHIFSQLLSLSSKDSLCSVFKAAITRQKDNAVYTSVSEKILTKDTPEVLKDEIIHQNYKDEKGKEQTVELRRIAWWDNKGKRAYEFITNNFDLDAAVIAEIYRYRWQIELFFKKLKQNFALQYFAGDN